MNYRIYVLDYRFQIMEAHDFVASNDISALDKGVSLSAVNPVEIWERETVLTAVSAWPAKRLPTDPMSPAGL